jgi:SAM-dependent methyltransferase
MTTAGDSNTTTAIDYFNSGNPFRGFLSRIALRARRGIYARFVSLAGAEPGRRLLDLGVTPEMGLCDSNFLERWYPHPADITMVSVEDCACLETVFPGTSFVRIEPGRPLPFSDLQFDVGFSSAVIEHVGGTEQQFLILRELLRTCRSVFLTTPNRAFPIEFHTFFPLLHWLPKRLHRRLLAAFGLSFWAEEANLNLLTRRALKRLLVEALHTTGRSARWSISNHRLLGLPSNLILWVSKD